MTNIPVNCGSDIKTPNRRGSSRRLIDRDCNSTHLSKFDLNNPDINGKYPTL